jgi:hypothetical protein
MAHLTIADVIDQLMENFDLQPPRLQATILRLVESCKRLAERPESNHQYRLQLSLDIKSRAIVFEREAKPLFDELSSVGIDVDNLSQLRKLDAKDRRALPILLRWLGQVSNKPLKVEIVSALDSAWAKPEAVQPLFDEFHRIDPATDPDNPVSVRSHIAGVLLRLAPRESADQLFEIAENPANGNARDLAVSTFKKFRKDIDVLVSRMLRLLDSADPVVSVPAAEVLARWRIAEAAPRVAALIRELDAEEHKGRTTSAHLRRLNEAASKLAAI